MHRIIRIFYLLFVRPWLKYIIGVQFENRKSMQGIDQCIFVANHNSHFDSLSILAAIPLSILKNTKTIAAKDHFAKTNFKKTLTKLFFNALFIDRKRENNSPSPIEIMDEKLKNSASLLLFPEGTRGEPGVISDFKKGVAILLKNNPNIPFVPVYLDGFGRVLPKDKKLIIPLECKVRFGNPIYPKSSEIETILEEVKDAIISLDKEDERSRNKFEY